MSTFVGSSENLKDLKDLKDHFFVQEALSESLRRSEGRRRRQQRGRGAVEWREGARIITAELSLNAQFFFFEAPRRRKLAKPPHRTCDGERDIY